jgi:predicted nucleotide-binding protein (sugar kinase/HSP70/actin superfamily)
MPFASDALAAAVARLTGSEVVVPPDPGTVGALGIALLACREVPASAPLDPQVFLSASVERKDTFVCKSLVGCGEPGNRCKIDSLHTIAQGRKQTFNWGGGCSLYDKGARRRKLPDRAPDPFREREDLARGIVARSTHPGAGRKIMIPDEFMMKGFLTFFSVFLSELGLDVEICSGNSQEVLKRGIQGANVPYCAPMQLFHGLGSQMADSGADYIFLPMLRNVTRVEEEPVSVTCPIVQASPDLLKWDLPESERRRIVSPVINIGVENLESPEFIGSCMQLARVFGGEKIGKKALAHARQAQEEFEAGCAEIGRRSLDYCREHDITPVIVLGRPYTIYNKVLNSNVPSIVREQGAIAIPVDCYSIALGSPVFDTIYWGYGQRILRAAWQVRNTPGHYSVYCSNYSCGPDGFLLHFYSYMMEGKPFSIIETDGHSGDAGTKTRIEAFLHCVREDKASGNRKEPKDFYETGRHSFGLDSIRQQKENLLVPWMGPGSEVLAATMRGIGIPAEALPMPDREALRLGRRYTSGKECLPMCLTLGGLLKRLEEEKDKAKRFAFVMPRTNGPCRLGAYHLLDQIVFERAELKDRVRVWAPVETGYFDGTPPGFALLTFAGFAVSDMLLAALFDTRPVESAPGAANAAYARFHAELVALVESQARRDLSLASSLWAVANGGLHGLAGLLRRAASAFAAIRGDKKLPTVLLVGEIYVRCDDFANDFIIDKLEQQGLRVRLAPFTEFFEYVECLNEKRTPSWHMGKRLTRYVQRRILDLTWEIMASELHWGGRHSVRQTLGAAAEFIREDLLGEAILTLGAPMLLWGQGEIDAVVSVGPLECLPNKISEAQFYHAAEKNGLLNLTLSLNGEPADPETLNNFAFEVHARFQKRRSDRDSQPGVTGSRHWMAGGSGASLDSAGCGHCPSCAPHGGEKASPAERLS